MKKMVVFLVASFLIFCYISAKTIRVITPYLGTIENDISRTVEGSPDELTLKDNSLFKGFYFQMVNPEKYQWNAFVYNSEDLNYSSLWGTHFIFDYYPGVTEKGKYVVGTGMEFLTMDTKSNEIEPFSDFELSQNIYAPYLRAGRYFYFGDDKIKYSFLPWLGFEKDMIRGDIGFTMPNPGPGPPEFVVNEEADDDASYALAGLNFKITFYHFVELKLKYHGKVDLKENDYYDIASSMLNIYFSRHWGVSYRGKYMKSAEMKNMFHIGGIIFAF